MQKGLKNGSIKNIYADSFNIYATIILDGQRARPEFFCDVRDPRKILRISAAADKIAEGRGYVIWKPIRIK